MLAPTERAAFLFSTEETFVSAKKCHIEPEALHTYWLGDSLAKRVCSSP